MKEFKWFLGILVLMGFIWFFNGGPERASSRDPFINPPAPLGEGGTYDKKGFWESITGGFNRVPNAPQKETETTIGGWANINPYASITDNDDTSSTDESGEPGVYEGLVEIFASSASQTDPDLEYLTIRISNNAKSPIVFNKWVIRSAVTGVSVPIAKASYLPRLGAVNEEQVVRANPGATLIITTGRSPIGSSFRVNKCAGYLSQFQRFSPTIPRQCPRPVNEIPAEYSYGSSPNAFNDSCLDYIERIGICRINTEPLPLSMQPQCQDFITKDLNYNACVSAHSNEEDFYNNEWRIYLKRDSELWKSRRETIELVDPNGIVVDSVSY